MINETIKALSEEFVTLESSERESFYETQILPIIRTKFRDFQSIKLKHEYDALILSVGTTYHPLLFSIEAVKPKKIYFLYTPETETQIDTIFSILNLKPSQIHKEEIDRINPTFIYDAIKRIAKKVNGGKIAIDFTGGTKSMAAGMAMAGAMIEADLIYISSKWSPDIKRVVPGSESLELVPNPYDLFGEIEFQRAVKLWKQGEFLAAAEILDQISKQLPDYIDYPILAKLARAYSSWESLELNQTLENFKWVLSEGKKSLIRVRNGILSYEDYNLLEKQLKIIEILNEHLGKKTLSLNSLSNKDFMEKLILYFYSVAVKRQEQKKLDLSALYLYRIIEMIFQHRIGILGISSDKPDYCLMGKTNLELIDEVNKVLKQANIKSPWTELPSQLALINSHLLLYALNDPVAKAVHPSRLRNATESRNYSILAHGYLNIDEDIFIKIKDVTDSLIKFIFAQEGKSVEQLLNDYHAIVPSSFH